jgi:hypothetical protein
MTFEICCSQYTEAISQYPETAMLLSGRDSVSVWVQHNLISISSHFLHEPDFNTESYSVTVSASSVLEVLDSFHTEYNVENQIFSPCDA